MRTLICPVPSSMVNRPGTATFNANSDTTSLRVNLVEDIEDEDFTVKLAYSNSGLPHLLEGDLAATVTVTDDISSTVDLRLSGSGSPFRVSGG